MAPEQCGGAAATAACDIYALGTTMYEALCGGPFEGFAADADILERYLSTFPGCVALFAE